MTEDLLYWPDRTLRVEKQLWRQTAEYLVEAVADARAAMAISRLHVAIATPLPDLPAAIGARCGLRVGVIEHATAAGPAARQESQHVVMLTHPEVLRLPQRMDLLRRCIRAVRPAGRLIIVANVVGHDRRDAEGRRVQSPDCTSFLDQLEAASGQGIHVDDLRSVRWGDEPIHRGALITMTRISTPIGW